MADLSDFKRGQIVGASIAGGWVKRDDLFGVEMSTVRKIIVAFDKERKKIFTEVKLRKISKAVW